MFSYFHGATSTQCEFMYDNMTGPGMTGLYASCGFTDYAPELEAWVDKSMRRVNDMDPLMSDSYKWYVNKRYAVSFRLVWVVAQLMNAYQQHHIDIRAVLVLTEGTGNIQSSQVHLLFAVV